MIGTGTPTIIGTLTTGDKTWTITRQADGRKFWVEDPTGKRQPFNVERVAWGWVRYHSGITHKTERTRGAPYIGGVPNA